jgi:hypothetical protein
MWLGRQAAPSDDATLPGTCHERTILALPVLSGSVNTGNMIDAERLGRLGVDHDRAGACTALILPYPVAMAVQGDAAGSSTASYG